MIITDIKTIRMTVPNDIWDIIMMTTDSGISGWGEVSSSLDINGVAAHVEEMKSLVIGHSPLEVETLTKSIEKWEYPSKKDMRCFRCAVSGVNQALWDLFAKELNVPLFQAYGCKSISGIPLYANLNKALRSNRNPKTMGEHAQKAMEEGFSFVKCTPFDDITPQIPAIDFGNSFEMLREVVAVAGIEKTAIDCHQRFNRHTLSQMIMKVEKEFGIPYWIEDTVEILDYPSQKTVVDRFPEIRFAAGEDAVSPYHLAKTINSGAYDVVMPDVKYIGGPSAVRSAISYAECMGKTISLHNPNGLIATAHSAHLSALVSNCFPLEFPFMASKGRESLAFPTEHIENGTYIFNDSPGIGIEIRDEALADYGKEYIQGSWREYSGGSK